VCPEGKTDHISNLIIAAIIIAIILVLVLLCVCCCCLCCRKSCQACWSKHCCTCPCFSKHKTPDGLTGPPRVIPVTYNEEDHSPSAPQHNSMYSGFQDSACTEPVGVSVNVHTEGQGNGSGELVYAQEHDARGQYHRPIYPSLP
jgi:hypothetical protein